MTRDIPNSAAIAGRAPRWDGWGASVLLGVLYYWLTTTIVFLGMAFGAAFVDPPLGMERSEAPFIHQFAKSAGRYYLAIASEGYSYRSTEPSVVVCFPAYPTLGALFSRFTGAPTLWSLVVLSHAFFIAGLVVLARFTRLTRPTEPTAMTDYALLSAGFFPGGLFFRCACSESLFFFLAVIVMYGLRRRWPSAVISAIVGLATGARPVGIVLLMPLAIHLWSSSPDRRSRLARLVVYLPLACWGLVAFMAFQYVAFDDALAFARNQQTHWRFRPQPAFGAHVWALLTFEPLRAVFDPASPCFWSRVDFVQSPFFSLQAANAFVFVTAIVLLAAGAKRRWLSPTEVVLAAGLLLLPYTMIGYKMGTRAMARFASVNIPLHIAAASAYTRLPPAVTAICLTYQAFFLGVYAAMFSAGYPMT